MRPDLHRAGLRSALFAFVICALQRYMLQRDMRAMLAVAALLGRFLPRLGPFGIRTAPFLLSHSFAVAFTTMAEQLKYPNLPLGRVDGLNAKVSHGWPLITVAPVPPSTGSASTRSNCPLKLIALQHRF